MRLLCFILFCFSVSISLPSLHAQESEQLVTDDSILREFSTKTYELPGDKKMNCHRRSGKGPTLVLVPGTWGDIHRFLPILKRMSTEIPVVVIELSWQGGHVPPKSNFTMEELADDVLYVIKENHLDEFIIGGHSIGGMITVEIAGRDVPGMIGAIPMEGWTHHTVTKTAFGGVVTGKLTTKQQKQRQANRTKGRHYLTEKQLKDIASIWRNWNGYEALERSKVPILHCWGDRGNPQASLEQLQIPDRPNIEVAWIENSSHSLMIENPQSLATAVTRFIDVLKEKQK